MKRKAFLKLDSVIRRYAWRKLLEQSEPFERDCLEMGRKNFTCIVDWTALTYKHEVTKFSPKVKDGTVIKTSRGDLQTGKKWVTLWSSCYDNLSKIKQSHAFRGSRDTTTWVEVDLEQCYTVNKEVGVPFNLLQVPYYFNAENTLNLNKFKGQVFQEMLNWETKTEVEVEPSSRAHAQLLARQECSVVEFEIRTTLSNPKGVVPVTFKYENDLFVLNIENLLEAFQFVEEGGVLKPEEKRCVEMVEEKWLDKDGVEHSTSHPQIITRGTCVCLSWSDQRVDIKTSPLSMDESTSDGDHNMNKTPVYHTEEDPYGEILTVRPAINIQTAKHAGTNLKNSLTLNLDDVVQRCDLDVQFEIEYYGSLKCEVDWKELRFEHKLTKFIPKVMDGTVISTSRGEIKAGTKWVKLLSCYFNNESEFKQSSDFRGSRDTTTWVDVNLEQCYTVNKKVCVQINLPQIPHFPMDKDIQLCLNEIKGRVFEEIRTWRVNTQVEVMPRSRAHAQLLVRQECSVYDFEIRTTLSNLKGNVNFIFTTEDLYMKRDMDIKDFYKSLQLVEDGGVLKPEEKACVELVVEKWLDKDGVEHSTSHPQIITRGTCVFLSWSDQRVDIKTSPLSMDESTSDGDHNMNKTPVNDTEEDPSVDSFVMVD